MSVGARGFVTAFRCKSEMVLVLPPGREPSVLGVGGTEADRISDVVNGILLFDLASISPLAEAILLVKDDMAQPAHEVSVCGVPILGGPSLIVPAVGGGSTLSGKLLAYRLTRLTKTSKVLLAWSRTILIGN